MSFTIAKGYTAKAPLDNPNEQMTAIMAWIGKDAGPMVPVKNQDGLKLLAAVKTDLSAKKFNTPLLKLGLDSTGNLVLRVEGAPKYEKSMVLVKGYEALKKERAKATVVNAQVGDSKIDPSAKSMAKAMKTTSETADKVDLNVKGDTAPIAILAHGDPTDSLPGKVYATHFAKKTPDEIVNFLVNDKKLAKNYAGVIYLDGCYTAAGPKQGRDKAEATNFAKKVYEKLLSKGYKFLQIKGNLGRAVTLNDGQERVLDAQVEAKLAARVKKIEFLQEAIEQRADDVKRQVAKLRQKADALVEKHKGNTESLKADASLQLLKEEIDKLEAVREMWEDKLDKYADELLQLETDLKVGHGLVDLDRKKYGKLWVDNLVGVFGPAKLASEPWYKKLFG